MAKERSCQVCRVCLHGQECKEHHRRCKDWPRNFNTFYNGSEITAILLQNNVLVGDLSKYEAIVDELREVDLEMEEDLDQVPAGLPSGQNNWMTNKTITHN